MPKFNTGNPVGSSDPRDLFDTAAVADNLVTGEAPAYNDRLGKSRKSWHGIESEFAAFIAAGGYVGTGTDGAVENYAAGIEITGYNQIVRDTSGEFWRLSGPIALPYTTTGAGLPEGGAFVAVGDAVLRRDLANPGPDSGSDLIAHKGTDKTVTETLDQHAADIKRRLIYVGSVVELQDLESPIVGQEALVLGAPFRYNGVNWEKFITYDEARKRLQNYNGGQKVREPLLGARYEWQRLASDTIAACERVTTDGTGTVVWQPDAGGFYNACWIRDMAMMMEWYPNYFTPAQIAAAFEWYLSYSNTSTDYQVPDHIGLDGTVFTTPGSANTWGARAPIDGNTYLLQLCWLHYRLTGSPALFNTHKQDVINLLEVGVPLNVDGVVEVPDDSAWYVCFGFQDTVRMSGVTAFGNMLVFQAYNRLAELSFATGDDGRDYLQKAETIKDYLNSTLFVEQSVTSSTFGIVRQVGFYKAATNVCQQLDAWASCFAVTCGVATESERRAIGSKLAYHLEAQIGAIPSGTGAGEIQLYSKDLFSFGGMRHVAAPDQFGATQMWEAYFSQPTYGEYQNGGHWSTPIAWVLDAMREENPQLAKAMLAYLLSEYTREEFLMSNTVPAEWWTSDLSVVGAVQYGTSGAVLGFADAGSLPAVALQSEIRQVDGQVISFDDITKVYGLSRPYRDEFEAVKISDSSFTVAEWCTYRIEASAILTGATVNTGAYMSLYLNGQEEARMGGANFDGQGVAFLVGQCSVTLQRGDVVDVRIRVVGGAATVSTVSGSEKGNYIRISGSR